MLWDSGRRPSMRETAPFRATAHRLTSELATLVEPFAASSLPDTDRPSVPMALYL
jgi:hypothetical protein